VQRVAVAGQRRRGGAQGRPDRGGRRISSAGDGDLERWVQSHLAIAGVLTGLQP
jgi:hypothetical protein